MRCNKSPSRGNRSPNTLIWKVLESRKHQKWKVNINDIFLPYKEHSSIRKLGDRRHGEDSDAGERDDTDRLRR